VIDAAIYRSLANELQRSLIESVAPGPISAQELRRLHSDSSPATIARAVAQLTERGLVIREASTLRLATDDPIDVLKLARRTPGGLQTLRVLANPLARAIVDQLLKGRRTRRALSPLGPAPRISDALTDLELLGAIHRDEQLLLLLEPDTHRETLDRVDELTARIHHRAYHQARTRLRARAANTPASA
jgi:DNA-binding transcriptional ArsR family regulator